MVRPCECIAPGLLVISLGNGNGLETTYAGLIQILRVYPFDERFSPIALHLWVLKDEL